MRFVLLVLILFPLAASQATEDEPSASTLASCQPKRLLFLGNSITLHGPAPKIGWVGNWGMAASTQQDDYVHRLTAMIAKATGTPPQTMVTNIADFESQYATYDVAATLKSELEFAADIVVVAIGENIAEPTTNEQRSQFAAAFRRLLKELHQHGQPDVYVRSCFWPSAAKDQIMRQASIDAEATFIDIVAIGSDEANAARSERQIEHPGVASHPGDKGMHAIADAIFDAITRRERLKWPTQLIGYTQLQTNLAGGRHANVRTMRAHVVKADGSGKREIASELIDNPNAWTQFAGWSPDGESALIARAWQSPSNAAIEEEQKGFHFNEEGWSLDTHLVDIASAQTQNLTAIDRVSFYNGGVFFWPGDSTKLGFTALIDGQSHPFKMDRDGHHKLDLTDGASEFTYGFSSLRDGTRIAYHKNYQVFLADADGSNATRVETGQPFNFGPTWSPDGQWVLFVSGQHYDCHPVIVHADGTSMKKLADRGDYRGVIEFLDVPDFHGGSSDTPVWSPDSQHVFYTAKTGTSVELFRVDLDGNSNQLTRSAKETRHYHPLPSVDGQWLAYGSKRDGVRQLYIKRLSDGWEMCLTDLVNGHAAMWPHWQPVSSVLGATSE